MVEMRKLVGYYLKPPQIGSVVAEQSNQIQACLQPSTLGHAAEDHASGAKSFELARIQGLSQDAINRHLGEIDVAVSGDPARTRACIVHARLYGEGKISLARAAEQARVSLWEMMDYARSRKIPAQYDLEDFQSDLKRIYSGGKR